MRVIKTTSSQEHEATRISIAAPVVQQRAYMASDEVRKIALPTMEGIQFEPVQQIISLEAKGNYTSLYFTDGRRLLVCKTLMEIETLLNNSLQFVRIHRSFIINLNRIMKYVRGKGGYVVMEDGSSRNVSNGRRDDFFKSLKSYFG
ncbi:MAG: two-component system LytT family response regulator [Polaribacter sp.]|jgi:two-component system LytT family response regulator